MIDQVQYILRHAAPADIEKSLKIMYGRIPRLNPFTLVSCLLVGFQETHFFDYVQFIRKLKSG